MYLDILKPQLFYMSFWEVIVPPLIGAGASLFGSASARSGASEANKQNLMIAREQMAFQERMYKHRHQYEVDDLRAAGLNPILSAQYGGGSSPPGASAQMQNENEAASLMASTAAKQVAESALGWAKVKTEKKLQQKLGKELDIQDEILQQQTSNSAQAVNDKKVEDSWYGKNVLPWVRKTTGAFGNIFKGAGKTFSTAISN